MNWTQILLVEDELHIAQGIIFNLEAEGYQVVHAETGTAALAAFATGHFSLVVLDLMLPDMDGVRICRQVRELDKRLPILILTARGNEDDRIRGLEAGADDYMTKPFNLAEFLLRVQGMLRRSEWYRPVPEVPELYAFGANEIDFRGRRAKTARGVVDLTELELRMLLLFFTRENEPLNRSELLQSVWGISPESETRTLDNFIVRLRKYFEIDPSRPVHFLTERGRGYRFVRNGLKPAAS